MHLREVFRVHRGRGWAILFLALVFAPAHAQSAGNSAETEAMRQSVRDLQDQIRDLQAAVKEIRQEAATYRAETQQLRSELAATRSVLDLRSNSTAPKARDERSMGAAETEGGISSPNVERTANSRLAHLEEQYELLSGKVDDQYQTKVESASKYRVRLSGIILLNLFSNHGSVDNLDFPSLATQSPLGSSGGSFGGTLRQSQLGLEVFGPHWGGARTRADLQFDFAGGFPQTLNGINTGLVRLRTGTVHLDWAHTSIVGGQDGLFFSPQSPTSFASLATPALGYSGNLWNWIPQVRVEHQVQLTEGSRLLLQGGILDGVSGEPPIFQSYRVPQAGEASGQPAYAGRAAWMHMLFGQPLTLGVAGYYSRQDYRFGRTVNGWAGMSDWDIPLNRYFTLSGKFYRGAAIGGLGGGIGRSVLFSDTPSIPATIVEPLNTIGGWAQLKAKATPKLEFNLDFGQDNPFAADIKRHPYSQAYFDPSLARSRGAFGNVIFRPRSDLLFSAEYKQLETYTIGNGQYSSGQVNLVMGVLF